MIPIRILSAQPSKDGEKWTITAQRHNDDWFTDAYGQDPQPFYRNPFAYPNRLAYPFRPVSNAYPFIDPLFPNAMTISIYTSPGQIAIGGEPPINSVSTKTFAPQVPLQATTGTGGTIAAGTWLVALVSVDADGRKSKPSPFITAVVPSGSSTIIISNIVFDSQAVSYELYFGPDSMHMYKNGGAGVTSSITLTTPGLGDGPGMPDVVAKRLKFIVTPVRHGGIWGSGASAITYSHTVDDTITIPQTATANQWVGRILTLYGSSTPVSTGPLAGLCFVPAANFEVNANDASGVMTVSQNTWSGIGFTPFTFPGDAYVMRAQANIASANTIGDSAFVNFFAPSGLIVDAEKGKVVWIIFGTGKGQKRTIASNTADTLTVADNWDTVPDSTSIFIVLESAPTLIIDSDIFSNDGVSTTDAILGVLRVSFTVIGTQSFLVQAVTEDADLNTSVVAYAPWQEVFLMPSTSESSLVTNDGTPVTY
jgi:hypothetical protein